MTEQQGSASGTTGLLLNAKLMAPRPPAALIGRDHLLTRLDGGLSRRLALVAAPTGFGKTTLVSSWIARRNFPSAWVTLDKNDNDPNRFWTYFVSALRALDPGLGRETMSALMSPQPPALEALLTPLLNDLARLNPSSVLVLEDFHAITSRAILDSLWFLIEHQPEPLHLVLITRFDPDLPLAILRARDQLVEITASQLRWNEAEAGAFLAETLKADLPPQVVTKLLERTEGWPAGLRLMALSLQNSSTTDIQDLGSTYSERDRYVSDYLIEEVFDRQPAELQHFLLKTCFFSRITGSLCDRLTDGNGTALLERLERENLFVVQLERRAGQLWYRYSALFAESLQHVARQRLTEAEISKTYEEASAWYEDHGLLEDAVETALAARLFSRALSLVEKFIEIHELREPGTLARWLEDIPTATLMQHPYLCFTYAQIILYTGDRFAPATAARLEPLLHSAEGAWRAAGDHQKLGELLSIRGTVAWWQGDLQKAFEFSRQSLAELPEQDVLYRGSSLLIAGREALEAGRLLAAQDIVLEARAQMGAAQNIHGVLAAIQMSAEIAFLAGELEQARQLNEQVISDAVGGQEMLDDQGIASLGLAQVAYEQNDLNTAEALAEGARDLALQRRNEMLQTQSAIYLSKIKAAQHDILGAMALLKATEGRTKNSRFLRNLRAEATRLSILAGDTLSLTGWETAIGNDQQYVSLLQKEQEAFTLARIQTARGYAAQAHETIRHWKADSAENGRIRSQVESSILSALAYRAQADLPKAAQALAPALKVGHSQGFRRLFLDEGPHMVALLQAASSRLKDRMLGLYVSTLLQLLGSAPRSTLGASDPVEPLSPQEIRVLRLLAAGLSNTDIAQELVVSTNTVKTQVKSIYRKLHITSRSEARDMAHQLKLV